MYVSAATAGGASLSAAEYHVSSSSGLCDDGLREDALDEAPGRPAALALVTGGAADAARDDAGDGPSQVAGAGTAAAEGPAGVGGLVSVGGGGAERAPVVVGVVVLSGRLRPAAVRAGAPAARRGACCSL